MNNTYVSFRNSILGFIIGDALGVPYEFNSKESMDAHPAIDMIGFGTHPVPPGTWSDDSSMMLIIMKWLIYLNKKSIKLKNVGYEELADLKSEWLNWFKNGYMAPYNECFDIGFQTKTSLINPELFSKDSLNQSAQGNGALMRILPFGWMLTNTDAEYDESVEYVMLKTCELTHGSFISNKFCKMFLQDIKNIRCNKTIDIAKIDLNIKSSGWVKDTYDCVKASSLKMLYFKDPQEAYKYSVLYAVNLGEDTDTVAAITGGLVGSAFDENCLPSSWLNCIPRLPMIENIIQDFYNIYVKTQPQ